MYDDVTWYEYTGPSNTGLQPGETHGATPRVFTRTIPRGRACRYTSTARNFCIYLLYSLFCANKTGRARMQLVLLLFTEIKVLLHQNTHFTTPAGARNAAEIFRNASYLEFMDDKGLRRATVLALKASAGDVNLEYKQVYVLYLSLIHI